MLHLQKVTKTFPDGQYVKNALTIDEFKVHNGEVVAVMGPSGSGKTTLALIAAGVEKATSGAVMLDDVNLTQLTASQRARIRRRQVGMVFQNDELDPLLTVIENVALPLQLDGMLGIETKESAEIALNRCGIADLSNRRRSDLSGGQRQRVSIARAITGSRQLIVADEPTASLDTATARSVVELLCEIARTGTAILFATHDARLAGFADRVVLLRDGRCVDGPEVDITTSRGTPTPWV